MRFCASCTVAAPECPRRSTIALSARATLRTTMPVVWKWFMPLPPFARCRWVASFSGRALQCGFPSHTARGTRTSPRMMSRAVRRSAARSTFCGCCGSSSSSTVNSPVGCSTETALRLPGGSTATPSATEPGSTAAVARVTAPRTPTAEWQSCGMKRPRAERAAGARRGDQRHLRHDLLRDVAEVHRRAGLQSDGFDARLELGVGIERIARLVAGAPEIGGADHDDGHAVVDAGHRHAVERVDARGRSAAATRTRSRRFRGS